MGISGKCDFEDTCSIYGTKEILDKYNIFISGHEVVPLKMESEKDLVAYYPYLVTTMCGCKEGGVIILSNESFIDREERERIESNLDTLKKYNRKCKRNKKEFDKEEALKKICWLPSAESYLIELINRVAEKGEKATIDGLHDNMHEYMRKQWFDAMVAHGWNEDSAYRWVYGFSRWIEQIKADKYGENTVQTKLDI